MTGKFDIIFESENGTKHITHVPNMLVEQVNRLVNEEQGISREVFLVSQSLVDDVIGSIRSTKSSLVDSQLGIYMKSATISVNVQFSETIKWKGNINWELYNYTKSSPNLETNGSYDYQTNLMRLRLIAENGILRHNDLCQVVNHELMHVYQHVVGNSYLNIFNSKLKSTKLKHRQWSKRKLLPVLSTILQNQPDNNVAKALWNIAYSLLPHEMDAHINGSYNWLIKTANLSNLQYKQWLCTAGQSILALNDSLQSLNNVDRKSQEYQLVNYLLGNVNYSIGSILKRGHQVYNIWLKRFARMVYKVQCDLPVNNCTTLHQINLPKQKPN